MDYTKWIYDEKEQMSLREVFEKHRTELPMLVIIIEGFYGITHEEDLGNLKVYWIRGFTTDKRCLAKQQINSAKERWLSIPLSTDNRFYTVKKRPGNDNKNALSIKDILRQKGTPVQVMFEGSRIKIGYVDQLAENYQPLTLLKEYEEHYLCCHEILDECLDRNRYLVATTVNIICSPINGHRDKTPEEFQTYLRSLEKTVADNPYNRMEGFKDITEVKWPDSGTGNQLPNTFQAMIKSSNSSEVHPYDDGYIEPNLKNAVLAEQSDQPSRRPPPVPSRQSHGYVSAIASKDFVGEHTPSDDNQLQFPETTMPKMPAVCSETPPLPPKPASRRRSEVDEKQWLLEMKIEEISNVLKRLKLHRYIGQFADDQIDGTILSAITDDILKDEYEFRPIEVIRLRKFIEKGHIPE